MKNLPPIKPKLNQNYIAFFLTFSCNLHCSYCINRHGKGIKNKIGKKNELKGDEWILAANRLILRKDLPLTLQGGEPTLNKYFYKIVNEVKENIKMDLLTNMMFDENEFMKNVPEWRFTREAPYAPIRVSYHPGQNSIDELIRKTLKMQDKGFRIGLYGILHPEQKQREHILQVQEKCLKLGIDFRTKEFLGEYKGKLYGTFKYSGAISKNTLNYCECKTSEIIVDPAGYVYKCHSDLYQGRTPIGHILEENFNEEIIDKFRECYYYGDCNPCDIKIKTNRLQEFGHTSVEIINIRAHNN